MARLTRQVGIRAAEVRLPERASVGNAIIKFGQLGADIAFEKAADKRTKEAQVAAAALNFERDSDGFLQAPQLPIGSNGLIAPSIYDREYTNMVSQRYVQQTQIDASKNLNRIASENAFDPQAYKVLAEGYISKVTELAPALLKPEVNAKAQIQMVEHFNRLVREKAERDHIEAGQVHLESIDAKLRDLAGYTQAGETDDRIAAHMLSIRADIEQGRVLNYYNDAARDKFVNAANQRYVGMQIISDISRLAEDEVGHKEALFALERFSLGEGQVKTIGVDGTHVTVDVMEVFPDYETRAAIVNAGMEALAGKEATRAGLQSAEHERQGNTFEQWWLPHIMDAVATGSDADIGRLHEWYKEAAIADNQPLMQRVSSIILGFYKGDGSGREMNRAERQLWLSWEDRQKVVDNYTAKVLDDYGVTSLDELSPVTRAEVAVAISRAAGTANIEQTAQSAESLVNFYKGVTGVEAIDFRTAPIGEIESWINSGPSWAGIITEPMSAQINAMLSSENAEHINKALDIGRLLYNAPALRKNMAKSTALGRTGEALVHIYSTRSPGSINAEQLVTELQKWNENPNYKPYPDWNALTPDVKDALSSKMESAVDSYFIAPSSVFGIGMRPHEVSSVFDPLRPTVGRLPIEMRQQLYNAIRERVGYIDIDDDNSIKYNTSVALDKVVREHGWVASELGWSETRFTDTGRWFKKPAKYVYTQFGPESFYKDPQTGEIDVETVGNIKSQLQLILDAEADDRRRSGRGRNLPDLVAGENAFLAYDPSTSFYTPEGRYVPSFNIIVRGKDDEGLTYTSGRYFSGDMVTVNFELAYRDTLAQRAQEREERKQRRITRAEMHEQVSIWDMR